MYDQHNFDFDEQQENLERVTARIGAAIIEFCLKKLASTDRSFHAEDLRRYVTLKTGISAPASADRVLRDLRQRGVITYRVLNRRESLYEVTGVIGVREPVAEKVLS
jgi:hypothetical protein